MIILHFHLQPQYKYELFHIYFTSIQLPVMLDLCLRKTQSGKSHDYCDYIIIFGKFSFQKVFRPDENTKPASSNPPHGLKSVFENLHLRAGFVWVAGLTVEKLRFQISLA